MGNKKVGILTLHRSLNYGAVWQCWALKTTCEQLGYEVEVIDYADGHRNLVTALRHRPDKVLRFFKMSYFFDRFINKRFNLTQHTESPQWLRDNPPHDDVFIVGSDQVWSESIVGKHFSTFMLDFAPADSSRIAYAVSMGGTFPTGDFFPKELRKFKAVSLREKTFVRETTEMYGSEVADVCDPSFLVNSARYKVEERKVLGLPRKYIALFNLDGSEAMVKCLETLKSLLKIPVVNISGTYSRMADKNLIGISPERWIYVMRNASFVCTDSFHGTTFSVIFKIPFITIDVGLSTCNNRMVNFLSACGLECQYITDVSTIKDVLKIDYSVVSGRIEEYKNCSLEWLKNSLEK